MSDLTEKFFNEEDIPEGLYYLKLKTGEVVVDEYPEVINDAYGEFERYGFKNSYIDNIEEVLAPVPEYNQWDGCLKLLTVFTKENKKLEASLNRKNRKWGKLVKDVQRINKLSVKRKKKVSELKKLLKECKFAVDENIEALLDDTSDFAKGRVKEMQELLTKIEEVLK